MCKSQSRKSQVHALFILYQRKTPFVYAGKWPILIQMPPIVFTGSAWFSKWPWWNVAIWNGISIAFGERNISDYVGSMKKMFWIMQLISDCFFFLKFFHSNRWAEILLRLKLGCQALLTNTNINNWHFDLLVCVYFHNKKKCGFIKFLNLDSKSQNEILTRIYRFSLQCQGLLIN